MILSVSRRTDIPAFYSEWFFKRLKEGSVLVRNPMNQRQISQIVLSKETVDCFAFWTKDPRKMLEYLNLLDGYAYYFQVTINPYNATIEKGLSKKRFVIESVQRLADKIGKKRIIWRYDPIFLSSNIDIDYHMKYFERLALELVDSVDYCVISFLDLYKKIDKRLSNNEIYKPTKEEKRSIAKGFSMIGKSVGLKIKACAELLELSSFGIQHSSCIDKAKIEEIIGKPMRDQRDTNQRSLCRCIKSVDIGAYNTCPHKCVYCYANHSDQKVINNYRMHQSDSPLLLGQVGIGDIIYPRKQESLVLEANQIRLCEVLT